MAITTEEHELTTVPASMENKMCTRPVRSDSLDGNGSTSGSISEDTASSTSGSDAEEQPPTATKPSKSKRRRKRNRSKKNNKNGKNSNKPTQPELPLEEQARYVAMDCEMVGVGEGGWKSVVARVTLVDWNGDVLLDQYIKPDRPVTDYRTFVSGIVPQHLEGGVDIDICRSIVLDLIEDKILIGHALKNDLAALGIRHPWYMTRDTAKYEPFMKVRFDDGVLWPRKLKDLCEEKIKRRIQLPGVPHSPYEDAVAALDLYKLARKKWEKAMTYKINKTREIEQQRVMQYQAAAAAQHQQYQQHHHPDAYSISVH